MHDPAERRFLTTLVRKGHHSCFPFIICCSKERASKIDPTYHELNMKTKWERSNCTLNSGLETEQKMKSHPSLDDGTHPACQRVQAVHCCTCWDAGPPWKIQEDTCQWPSGQRIQKSFSRKNWPGGVQFEAHLARIQFKLVVALMGN
jgi:hypothetical protein